MIQRKILITGGTGLLGKYLIETSGKEQEIIATYVGSYTMFNSPRLSYFKLDIRNKEGYADIFNKFKPDVVIHAVSVGSPDYAEKNRELSREVDVVGTRNIVSLCEKFNSRLIHISSNGIYDGKHAPYAEDDPAQPINYYGSIKLESEKIVKSTTMPFAIIRPILMYGWNYSFERPNITVYALEKLRKGESVNIYEDVFCNPVSAKFCALSIWRLIHNDNYDVFNIGGKDMVSIYQLVKAAATIFGLNPSLVKPVRQGFLNGLIERPENTSYKTTKMENILGLKPLSIREGLGILKEEKKSGHV